MAQYQTGIATSRADLMSKLHTFSTTNGWTNDEYNGTAKRMSLHKANCYVHFWWDDTNTAREESIGLFQSLGYTGGNVPHAHPDDAGGWVTAPYETYQDYKRKKISYIGDGPFTAYHFFAYTDIDCIHCVLELTPGVYRHFGFGTIDKFGPQYPRACRPH